MPEPAYVPSRCIVRIRSGTHAVRWSLSGCRSDSLPYPLLLFACLLSLWHSVCPSVCLNVPPSVHLHVRPSVRLPDCLLACLFVNLSAAVCLSLTVLFSVSAPFLGEGQQHQQTSEVDYLRWRGPFHTSPSPNCRDREKVKRKKIAKKLPFLFLLSVLKTLKGNP